MNLPYFYYIGCVKLSSVGMGWRIAVASENLWTAKGAGQIIRPMQNRKLLWRSTVGVLGVGAAGLLHLMEQPRFHSYPNGDVLQLIACGASFGVALSGLLSLMRRPRASEG